MLGYLLALLFWHRGAFLLSITSIVADFRIHSGALLLVHCLVGSLHICATLCVFHSGAVLPVGCLVGRLAFCGIARGALGLHLGGVRGLVLRLALPV